MAEQVAHAREALMAQGPVDISPADPAITTAFDEGWQSEPFACSRFRSVGLELDITPDDATTLELLLEVSNDGKASWSPAFYQTAITTSLRTLKPDITQITIADLDPVGGDPANNRVKLPPIDVRDIHWIRLRLKKTGGSGYVEALAYATGGQGA